MAELAAKAEGLYQFTWILFGILVLTGVVPFLLATIARDSLQQTVADNEATPEQAEALEKANETLVKTRPYFDMTIKFAVPIQVLVVILHLIINHVAGV